MAAVDDSLTAQVEDAAVIPDPQARVATLRVLRDEVVSVLGRIDTYLSDSALQLDGAAIDRQARLAAARENADLREALLVRGLASPEALDELGLVSHEVLGELAEEGLLEAALEDLYAVEWPAFDEHKHPRGGHGRFKATLHDLTPSLGSRGGGAGGATRHEFGAAGRPKVKGRKGQTVKHPTPRGPKPAAGSGAPGAPRPEGMSPEFKAKAEALGKRSEHHARKALSADEGKRLVDAEQHFGEHGGVSQHELLRYVRAAAAKPDTTATYALEGPDGKLRWDPRRKALHEAVIDAFLRQRRTNPDTGRLEIDPEGAPLEPHPDGPRVMFTGGGYAAGKGASERRARAEGRVPPDAFTLDPDQVKALIPEFQEGLSADDPEANLHVYREAWEIAQEIQRRAQERKLNVIVDGISDTSVDEVMGRVEGFQKHGYQVHMVYTDIPTEVALGRAAHRAATAKSDSDRRHIPEIVMRAVHRDVAATIPKLLEHLAAAKGVRPTVEVYDNDQGKDEQGNFRPPKLFASFDGKALSVVDEPLWKRLQVKAKEKLPGVGA